MRFHDSKRDAIKLAQEICGSFMQPYGDSPYVSNIEIHVDEPQEPESAGPDV